METGEWREEGGELMLVEIFSQHSCHQQTDQVGPVQVEGRKVDPAGSAS